MAKGPSSLHNDGGKEIIIEHCGMMNVIIHYEK